jgi:hypothetical protein
LSCRAAPDAFFHDTSRQAVKTASLTRHGFHASHELIRLRASKSGGSVSLRTTFTTKKSYFWFLNFQKYKNRNLVSGFCIFNQRKSPQAMLYGLMNRK